MHIRHRNHLSYCTNIHGGETWDETFDQLSKFAPGVKKELGIDALALGLRLSQKAAEELLLSDHLDQFKEWLQEHGLYIPTINGFPYGDFHGSVVKDAVHRPDWSTKERLSYTKDLFRILSNLLPENMTGGISTSPLSYRRWFLKQTPGKKEWDIYARAIREIAVFLDDLEEDTGKLMHLDIEPEPDGVLQTTEELIAFYENHLIVGLSTKEEQLVRKHIRVCLDVCHSAVMFENPAQVLQDYKMAEISIGRIQISSAPCALLPLPEEDFQELETFVEEVYLHQTLIKAPNGELHPFSDLQQWVIEKDKWKEGELRTHYHVPIFLSEIKRLKTTQGFLKEMLRLWKQAPFCQHLEVETYTWHVLPDNLQLPLTESIARELNWVKQEIQ